MSSATSAMRNMSTPVSIPMRLHTATSTSTGRAVHIRTPVAPSKFGELPPRRPFLVRATNAGLSSYRPGLTVSHKFAVSEILFVNGENAFA